MSGFTSPEEFDAWQLAWELKERIAASIPTGPAVRDGEFCKEILFVRIARGSLGEVRNQLRHAHSRKYLTDAEYGELNRLCRRAIGASTGLRMYLLSLPKNFDPRKMNPNPPASADENPEPEP